VGGGSDRELKEIVMTYSILKRYSIPFAVVLLATGYSLWTSSPAIAADAAKPVAATQPSQADLDAKFAAQMTNVVLAGHYTLGAGAAKADKYTIASVKKLKGDDWLFSARVQFAGKDVTIPIIIPVKWAGDTPVISVTNVGFPGLGSYTARVMIYGDQYAGTWQDNNNKEHGGHLWGKIEKVTETKKKDE
jgi:hypothetical protein